VRAAALIPALDCSGTIAEPVRGAAEYLERVLVVDDGSTDGTAETARRAGAEVLVHPENLGKGASLLDGLRQLGEQGFTHAVTLDGDGQHYPTEIPKLLAEAETHPEAFVVGARQIEQAVAWINRFGNELANLWLRIASGRDLGDTQSGFRVYPIAATLALQPVGQRFDFETEILIRAARAGHDVRSVPIRVFYAPPDERQSHYDKLWDTLRIVRIVLELMLRLR
jgi:glycosyltransferase involved in cell wall biosynthesis